MVELQGLSSSGYWNGNTRWSEHGLILDLDLDFVSQTNTFVAVCFHILVPPVWWALNFETQLILTNQSMTWFNVKLKMTRPYPDSSLAPSTLPSKLPQNLTYTPKRNKLNSTKTRSLRK